MMKKALVAGCSFTAGHGLDGGIKDSRLWINQIFDDHDITNTAISGLNNHSIFIASAQELKHADYDIALVAWSAIPRFNLKLGLEVYSTVTMLKDHSQDVNLNPYCTVSNRWQKKVGDQLRKYHNDHWDILHLVNYVNILIDLTRNTKTKIFFVNALCPWPDGYFNFAHVDNYRTDLNSYYQNLIQIRTRDDIGIGKLYEKIHNDYESAGGIHEEYWLNLYHSLVNQRVDSISDSDNHPGYLSQDMYAKYFKDKLDNI